MTDTSPSPGNGLAMPLDPHDTLCAAIGIVQAVGASRMLDGPERIDTFNFHRTALDHAAELLIALLPVVEGAQWRR